MATRLNTALDRRAELKAEGLKLLDIAASNRTDEQSARLDAIDKDITAIDGDIDCAAWARRSARRPPPTSTRSG